MTNISDTQAAVDAGRQTASASSRVTWLEHPLDKNIRVPVAIFPDGAIGIIDDASVALVEMYEHRPRIGTTPLTEVDSFIALLNRLGSEQTVVYADTAKLAFTAVLDDHPADPTTTAARQHRATYACPRSPQWLAWTELDGKQQTQTQFADFVESHLEDMIGAQGFPMPTEVLQMARNLHVLTQGEFRREINPTNGDSVFVCKTQTDAKSTQIPRAFMLAIPVFDGGDRYQVEARVRFTLASGAPSFSYTLHRRAEIERDAFAEVRAKVAKETGRLVLAGTPGTP